MTNEAQGRPDRAVEMPRTVPLPGLEAYRADQQACAAAEEAKWQKQLSDYEAAKAKAEAEGKDAPKAPVKPVAKPEGDLKAPVPTEARDADLLRLKEAFGDAVEEIFEQAGECTAQIARDRILEVLRFCRQDPSMRFEMLADETATHYPAASDFAFSVVYHLASLSRSKRLRLRVLIPEGFELESATQVHRGANWFEREIFDMFGIRFLNHPDLTRILCPEDWEAFPLRKEYPVAGLGQRDIDFREDRSGCLTRRAQEQAGHSAINLKIPTAD